MSQKERAKFGSKLGMILATAGGAVGLGNVWRFPYTDWTERRGCLYPYLYWLYIAIGASLHDKWVHYRASCSLKYSTSIHEIIQRDALEVGRIPRCADRFPHYGLLCSGLWLVFTVWNGVRLVIIYMVVLSYFKTYFTDFSTNPWKPIVWASIILLITHYIIIHGVRNGIERASKVMMPALFILLLVLVVASCLLPGAERGVEFLLKPDFSKVTRMFPRCFGAIVLLFEYCDGLYLYLCIVL